MKDSIKLLAAIATILAAIYTIASYYRQSEPVLDLGETESLPGTSLGSPDSSNVVQSETSGLFTIRAGGLSIEQGRFTFILTQRKIGSGKKYNNLGIYDSRGKKIFYGGISAGYSKELVTTNGVGYFSVLSSNIHDGSAEIKWSFNK